MPLITGRFREVADVIIDREKCTVCGLCVKVCRGAPLYLDNGKICIDQTRVFGCVACGQCVTVCPNAAIRVEGRDMTQSDIVPIPTDDARPTYEQFQSLLLSRRSVRDFLDKEVEKELIDKILASASTAPMGLPPTDVGVLVFSGRDKVRKFKDELLSVIKRSRWFFSPWMLKLMRPFMSKETAESMASFGSVVMDVYSHPEKHENKDWFFYDAPLAIFFYTSGYADPVDPIIPATYAMLAAHSLGLGTCMLGLPGVIMKMNKAIKRKYCKSASSVPGLLVVFGYPSVHYQRAIIRHFASVDYI